MSATDTLGSPRVLSARHCHDDAGRRQEASVLNSPQHRTKLHSANLLERLNGEIKRRTEVVGIFLNEAAITRFAGAILLEQNVEWAVQRARYITLLAMIPSSACPSRQTDRSGSSKVRRPLNRPSRPQGKTGSTSLQGELRAPRA